MNCCNLVLRNMCGEEEIFGAFGNHIEFFYKSIHPLRLSIFHIADRKSLTHSVCLSNRPRDRGGTNRMQQLSMRRIQVTPILA